jgi:hypothetical protein
MRSSRSAQTTPGTACPVRDRGTFVMPPRRASFALGLAAFMLLAPCALIPAHATDANEPESSSVASDLEQEQEASRLELRSVADEAKLAAKALAALEDDIAALRADQQELDRRIAETAARRADLDRRITAGEQSMTGLSERQESVRLSLLSRRSVLAEVLAALAAHRPRSATGSAGQPRRRTLIGQERHPARRSGSRDPRRDGRPGSRSERTGHTAARPSPRSGFRLPRARTERRRGTAARRTLPRRRPLCRKRASAGWTASASGPRPSRCAQASSNR